MDRLKSIQSGEMPSAADIRRLAETVDRSKPSKGSGGNPTGLNDYSGGYTPYIDDPDWHYAEVVDIIDTVDGSPVTPRRIVFKEKVQNWTTGLWEDKPDGVYGDSEARYTYALEPDSITFTIGDIIEVRRHPTNLQIYESRKYGASGSVASQKRYAVVVGMPTADPGPYIVHIATMTGPGVFAETSPTESIESVYRWPSNVSAPNLPRIQPGQYIEVWPSPTSPGDYECHPWGSQNQATISVSIPKVTGIEITITSTGCDEDGNPTFTASYDVIETDYTLTIILYARDLVSISSTYAPTE